MSKGTPQSMGLGAARSAWGARTRVLSIWVACARTQRVLKQRPRSGVSRLREPQGDQEKVTRSARHPWKQGDSVYREHLVWSETRRACAPPAQKKFGRADQNSTKVGFWAPAVASSTSFLAYPRDVVGSCLQRSLPPWLFLLEIWLGLLCS